MRVDSTKGTFGLRGTALVVLSAAMLWGSAAPAYDPIDHGSGPVSWRATSPPTVWDDAAKTLSWTFYDGNFPRATWPTAEEAGAALQNATQSITDVTGKRLSFVRLANSSTIPPWPQINRDGVVTYAWVINETSDFYGTDITGANAVTYVDDQAGVMQDADMFINGDTSGPNWTVDGTGGRDVQATGTHESMHVAGAGHIPYFSSRVFPFQRTPVVYYQDHGLAPDDRNYLRAMYPAAVAANGTLSGRVEFSPGSNLLKAMVIATDANDVPQAIMETAADGTFSALGVPPGTYTLTAFHGFNSPYRPTSKGSDVDFVGDPLAIPPVLPASVFVNATTTAPVVVTAGNNTAAPTITATPGTPGLKLTFQSVLPTTPQFQSLFVSTDAADPTNSGTIDFFVDTTIGGGGNISAAMITSVTLGTGVTVNGPITTAPFSPNETEIFVPYIVSGAAIPGQRNISINLNVNGGERLFLPGVLKVVGQGGLNIAASAANPAATGLPPGTLEAPLLGLSLQAVAANPAHTEDVRVRRLAFNIAGSGPALTAVRLWVDVAPAGVSGLDTRIYSGAAYANFPISETIKITPGTGTPPGSVIFDNLALTIPAGATVNLLLTADTAGPGTGTYTASFDPAGTDSGGGANIVADGLWWGEPITPTGTTLTGGTLSTDPLTLTALQQTRTTGGATIPVGGSTPEVSVTIKGVVTTSNAGTVGMDIEVQPLITAFTNIPTGTIAGQASGATLSIVAGGLADPQSYHWQARATHSVLPAGSWVSFGSNAETAIDFSRDSSTTNPPTALAQFEKDGITPVPPGGLVKGRVVFSATNGTNSAAGQVRLEIEARPNGTAFTGTPNVFSSFGASGAAATASFVGPSGLYHWQARTSNTFGTASTWVAFSVAPPDFDFKRTGGGGSGGCSATIAGPSGGLWWALLALGLLVVFGRQRTV